MMLPEKSSDAGGEASIEAYKKTTLLSVPIAGAATGALIGFYSSAHVGIDVNLAPDVSGKAYLRLNQPGVNLTTAVGGPYLPNANAKSALGTKGVEFKFDRLGFGLQSTDVSRLTAIAVQPESAFGKPIQKGAEMHAAIGAGTGLVLSSIALGGVLWNRRRRAEVQACIAKIENNPASGESALAADIDKLQDRLKPSRLGKTLRRAAIIGAVAITSGTVAHTVYEAGKNEHPSGVPVSPAVANRLEITKGALITGPNSEIFESGLKLITDSIDRGEKYWRTVKKNYWLTEAEFAKDGSLDFLDNPDPDVKNIWVVPGTHCNLAYINGFMAEPIKDFNPDVVAFTGDIYSARKTSAIENRCLSDMQKVLGKIPYVLIQGNHDPDGMKGVLGDKKAETRTTAGIDFVGASEPTISMWGPTLPEDPLKRLALIAKTGEEVAGKACAQAKTTGIRPVVLVHRAEEGYETEARGCASIVISDHGADNLLLPRLSAISPVDPANEPVYQQIAVTASGADGGITQFAPAERPASGILESINIKTGSLVRSIRLVIRPNTETALSNQKLPKQRPLSARETAFLEAANPR